MSLIKEQKAKATRVAFGDEILELGKENQDIVVVDADIGGSCKTGKFMSELPNQHINVGIAEQNAAGIAAGLSTTGKVPFVSTYAVFGSLRMGEQVRQEICYPNLNVKIACSHGGLTPATDGGSHQAIEDMGVLRTFPNMKVIMGADYHSTRKLIREASKIYGPVYLRFTRGEIPIIYDENETFEIGKAKHLKNGKDIAIIANGDTLNIAIKAAEKLEELDISVKLLDMHTIKPIDREAILECINIGKIITVEDHNIINGLGSAVSEIVAEEGNGKVRRIGVQDQFGQSAPYEKLLEINGITKENIIDTAKNLMKK
ncbi:MULTISPECIES: transketolase family protein [Staphylococcus]|jgi:transketolase|uniref:Pyruvate dehydrogenase E1 component subunit beta n=1 Tax=Staphylococcus pseudoxylosus TaxID=2282419 RepID=A0AAQ0S5G4_9STAP|nr:MULTISPECIES: transketolase C-terminal domain-containing protein [Staphylococcus]PTI57314.1 transketolase [Staphylococcus xylosus]MCE5003680.1 transketolase family protein [Staphylococcus pseudoxylosus]PTE75195.1 transketolase [Staphylococcus gallinarum]PTK12194.1 transketolase [Staphylococcus saprophyticus]PUZ31091.1 transketolase [Staphylococcus arlettae]